MALLEGRSQHKAIVCDRPVASKRTAIGVRKQPEANLDFLEGEADSASGAHLTVYTEVLSQPDQMIAT